MRKVGEEKQAIDLDRKIKVELTLEELVVITSAIGATSTSDRSDIRIKLYPQITSVKENRGGLPIFNECMAILDSEGIDRRDD
ncbi:hypothetical protein [Oceanobacillus sojae]|uniref:hypothetical protein n=1 Tax=Oceanobacillus sojae TaxID=582851 RepID=UPI0009886624|nr:hypothetical protein [Oceanobacillus sojae]